MSKNLWNPNQSITTVKYGPIGADNTLQREITNLMHFLVKREGKTTLGELGYFYMNTVTYVEDHIEVKLYFHPELATKTEYLTNGKPKYYPNPALNVFKGYLFVGDLAGAVSYDTIDVPKYRIEKTDRKRLVIRNNKKMEEGEEVLVLNCNLSMVLAAVNGVDLADPNFSVTYETVAAPGKKMEAGTIVVSVNAKREFPVSLTVNFTDQNVDDSYQGYNPDSVVPYLIAQMKNAQELRNTQRELATKISEDAATITKKRNKAQFKSYSKYR